ncbi:hypothetical protein D9613_008996 [Agrocybe pediades]|uniref:Uncharacterized protein n=1 Tax=Agrocybe pediades TaxID=84607 RepID=A0A8H4R4T6_9AGAR|nr:hypothetical protein D9613_008996 [Agrocybe pediades]
MKPYENYILPGLEGDEGQKRLKSLITALTVAHSGRANPRRLEDPSYAFWGMIFDLIVSDLAPEVISCAQFRVYPSQAQEIDLDVSNQTVHGREGAESIPDFVHLAAVVSERKQRGQAPVKSWPELERWDLLTISRFGLLTIGEIKRPAPRHHADRKAYQEDLLLLQQKSRHQAEAQAKTALNDGRYKLEGSEVVLIAGTGDWWSFRYFKPGQEKLPSSPPLRKDRDMSKRSGPHARSETFKRYMDIDSAYMELPVADINDAEPPEGEWSGLMRFGTPASNQRLFVVHRKIKLLKDALTVINEPVTDTESQAEEDTVDDGDDIREYEHVDDYEYPGGLGSDPSDDEDLDNDPLDCFFEPHWEAKHPVVERMAREKDSEDESNESGDKREGSEDKSGGSEDETREESPDELDTLSRA